MYTISSIFTDKEVITNRTAVRILGIATFIVMTTLGAYVRIPLPFTPVPITLQTFFVLLCGAVLGKKLGVLSQFGYVMLGAAGMPIFQGYGAGITHLLGPTGGYLLGFIIAPFLIGNLLANDRYKAHFYYVLFSMLIGLCAIYLCGISWLMVFLKINFTNALFLGFVPFIPGMIGKLIVAAWIYSRLRTRTDALFSSAG